MIALSSIRPFTNDPSEHNHNQTAAWRSWQSAFDAVFYFAAPEERLSSPKTRFLHWEPFPRIRDMALVAAGLDRWSALVNADIIAGPGLAGFERKLVQMNITCASSWRYQFNPRFGIGNARVSDNGLDFFAAIPAVWRRVAAAVPEELRMGVQWWDTWMLSFFNAISGGRFADITPSRLVFHPLHGNRKYGPGFDHRGLPVFGKPIMGTIKV